MTYSEQNKLVDGENNPVNVDTVYSVTGDNFITVMEQIKRDIDSEIYLLPLSGRSGGGGIFQAKAPDSGIIAGVQIVTTPNPRVHRSGITDITRLALDEIIIDAGQMQIVAGSSITLDQLNRALAYEFGGNFKVLGADLTSYTYAQVGATFMTGGMGPQRRYFSDSVTEIALYNGDRIVAIDGSALANYAGTYGWSGLVTAVRCTYVELPASEVAFAIPANNVPSNLARLLQHFSRFAFLKIEDGRVLASNGGSDLILGLEHITTSAMEPLFSQSVNSITRRAKQLAQKCIDAGADGLIFVNGFSNSSVDDFLLKLVDDGDADKFTIAGVDLEHTEIFPDPGKMREVREAVPFAARMQAPRGQFTYKGHTDANIRLHADKVKMTMEKLWNANQEFVGALNNYFARTPGIEGEVLVYGHLNPYGVDPHNRITFGCDQRVVFDTAVSFVHARRDQFLRTLNEICEWSGSEFIGGEKSAGSEAEMFAAFGGLRHGWGQTVYNLRIMARVGVDDAEP